ncbi:CehA/McbA family metallohydrolase [Planotetraspora sp. A-T 1434]|uniref:CehA/McbA family metallohydrolase n=1 Tax=Planotetraspora sp. A-T 1434 TaxID=2979219 RepID=UPI0021C08D31|nr:CehA/McbA family metallohydrolase [Planotetraspora sp. A-T 1434]MCT9934489.1 CehA/McbA family metallohydrolase [Planotetraspora sp. A-T 1434]
MRTAPGVSLASDDLLVILGQEVTSQTGHWLALGIHPGQVVDWRYRVRDDVIDQHLDQVHQAGGLCVAAHPHAPYPSGVFMYPYQGFDVVEVWNGLWTSSEPWNADNEAALAEWGRSLACDIHSGQWRPAMGNSDTHLEGQIGTPHTVVLAEELSSDAALAGIRAGHTWIAESATIELSLKISAGDRSADIGERLETCSGSAVVRVDVRGVPSGTVNFHTVRVRCTANRCPAMDQVSWSGAPTRRNRRSSASRYPIPEVTWRRSPTPSSWPEICDAGALIAAPMRPAGRSAFRGCTSMISVTVKHDCGGSGAGLKDLMARMEHDNVRAAMIYQHAVRGADRAITEAITDAIADAIDKQLQARDAGEADEGNHRANELVRDSSEARRRLSGWLWLEIEIVA